MKFVIIGSALSGNKGAAAMLESSVQTLTAVRPGAKFTLLSMYPKADAEQNPFDNLDIIPATPLRLGLIINPLGLLYRLLPPLRPLLRRTSRSIRCLAEADALLDQGGITFNDGREVFLIYNVASILPGLMVKTPVIKCAQALGPFKNRINRLVARLFLPRMALIVSRGAITHQHLELLGLANVEAGADYAFALEVEERERRNAHKRINAKFFKGSPVVGVSPSVVLKKKVEARGQDYTQLTAGFIDYLTKRKGYKVFLVPHSVRSGTDKQHNNDLPLCREVYARLKNPENCLFIDDELPSQELRYLIGRCDLFVASRFHAMVSALAMSVPTLVIGWSHKYQEVLEMFDLEDWAFSYDRLRPQFLRRRFDKLEANQKDIRRKLKTHLPEVKQRSRAHVDLILNTINSHKK